MRIRASVMTQILAVLTVAALVGTGVVLGQSRRGEASATLLDSVPALTVAAATNTAPVTQPAAQNLPVVESAPSGATPAPSRPRTTTPPTTVPAKPPSTTVDTEPKVDPPVQEVDHPDEVDSPDEVDTPQQVDAPDEVDTPDSGATQNL
jgi:hypothetical protein